MEPGVILILILLMIAVITLAVISLNTLIVYICGKKNKSKSRKLLRFSLGDDIVPDMDYNDDRLINISVYEDDDDGDGLYHA